MNFLALFQNKALIVGLTAWALAQVIKIPLDYLRTRRWNWALLLTTGGMPSSHSALMTATTLAIGLYYGLDSPAFALGVVITMIVTYDAAGRRFVYDGYGSAGSTTGHILTADDGTG